MAFDKVKASLEADKKYKTGKIREQNYLVILDAAETLFAEHGFKGASMMSIANETFVSDLEDGLECKHGKEQHLHETVQPVRTVWDIIIDGNALVLLREAIADAIFGWYQWPLGSKHQTLHHYT